MTTSLTGSSTFSGSAKIYTFPARGRFAQTDAAHAEIQLPKGVAMTYGNSWYHDEAIQDAAALDRGRKN